jgi:uncharacterized membrane protein YphA (DoxX/SURF4 family)
MPSGSPRLAVAGPWAALLARLLLAGVFATAGALKLPDPDASVRAVRAYELLPEAGAKLVGRGLPVLEVALAAVLVVGLALRLAAVLSALLLAVFIAGIVSVAARGISIDCGCFGGGGEVADGATQYTAELIRDGLLLVLALALVRWPRSRLALDGWLAGPPAPYADLDHGTNEPDGPDGPDRAPEEGDHGEPPRAATT